jgi:hypothetical protein
MIQVVYILPSLDFPYGAIGSTDGVIDRVSPLESHSEVNKLMIPLITNLNLLSFTTCTSRSKERFRSPPDILIGGNSLLFGPKFSLSGLPLTQ